MSRYDFTPLKDVYPQIIDTMPDPFTTHQFILALAQRHQGLYIDALAAYRHIDGPFRKVHGELAQMLREFAKACGRVKSRNIFGKDGECEQWRKRLKLHNWEAFRQRLREDERRLREAGYQVEEDQH